MAAAVTGSPLLSRIKRLLAVEGTPVRDGLGSVTLVNLAVTLTVLVMAAVVVEGTQTKGPNTEGDQQMNGMIDVTPSNRGDTLPLCLSPLMQAVGRPEWSRARLEGLMGHAFHFEMKEGPGTVIGRHVARGS